MKRNWTDDRFKKTVQELNTGYKLMFYEEFLTLQLRDIEVNPMFPKRSSDWVIGDPASHVEPPYLRM